MTSNRDAVPTLAQSRERLSAYLDGLPLRDIALAILDHVGANGEEPLSLVDVHRAAGREPIDGEVLATLSHLTASREAPLERQVVYRDGEGRSFRVAADVLALAEGNGTFSHPLTGEAVPEPLRHFYLYFAPRPGLLRDVEPASAPAR